MDIIHFEGGLTAEIKNINGQFLVSVIDPDGQ
jgi:hypothetical protein